VENNQVSTISVFKRNFVGLFGQSSQQQQAKAGERYLQAFSNLCSKK
jgi:hypothetical protein